MFLLPVEVAKITESFVSRYFPRTFENMRYLLDDKRMVCRVSDDESKTIWSGAGLIRKHTHLHTGIYRVLTI